MQNILKICLKYLNTIYFLEFKMKYFTLLLLIFSINIVNSQIINKWNPVYKEKGSFNDFSRHNNLQSVDKDNILIIDSKVSNTSPFLALTKNGGSTWDTVFEAKAFEHEINSIAFPKEERLVWVGAKTIYQGSDDNWNPFYLRNGVIYTSSDAGKNWESTTLDTNTMLDYVFMINDNIGIANLRRVGNRYNQEISFWDTLLYTNDFFKTYTKIPVPDSLTWVEKVYMFSEDNFIIQTTNYILKKYKYLETTDRGKTWTEFMNAGYTMDLDFVNRLTAYKIEAEPIEIQGQYVGKVFKTVNGGKDWIFCFASSDEYWGLGYRVISLAAADADNAIAIGTNCAIHRTTDGGLSWQKEFAPNISGGIDMEYDNFSEITYPEKNCAYIMGGGYLFKMDGSKILSRPILNRYSQRISPSGIKAFWKPVQGAKKYNLQLAYSPTNTYDYSVFDHLTLDTIVTDTVVRIPDLDYNKCYYARIKAIAEDIESGWNIKAAMFCTFENDTYTNPPEIISPKLGEIVKTSFCEIKWTSITGAEKYQLMYSDNPYFSGSVSDNQNITDTVFKTPDLVAGQKYYVRLRVLKGSKITNWVYTNFTIADPSSVINFNFDDNSQITVYPNPANDFIEISIPENSNHTLKGMVENGKEKVQIFNTLGIEVGQSSLIDDKNRIDISHLQAGIYFIKIGDKVEKFVKM
jgi:photosystem II stability/assembly factor-like uncharacterized protein